MKKNDEVGVKAVQFLQLIAGKPTTEAKAREGWRKMPEHDKKFTLTLYGMLGVVGATEASHAKAKVRRFPKGMVKEYAESCMKTAQDILVTKPPLLTAVLFIHGEEMRPLPLDMRNHELMHAFVKAYVLANKPDAAVIISDAYMLKVKDNPDAVKNYRRGDAERSPDRIEAITVTVGSIHGILGVFQPYHRDGDQIIFDPRDPELEQKEPTMKMTSAFFDDAWEILHKELMKQGPQGETVH